MKVFVKTPARLHLGLIDLRGDLGRIFGGLGVAIDKPNVILEAQDSNKIVVEGPKQDQVRTLVERFLNTYQVKTGVSIRVQKIIPEHSGLGSGTQLALAVAAALAKLFRLQASVQELASTMGRGKRTGIGTAIFEQGGFVIDGGKKVAKQNCQSDHFPVLLCRQPFPEDWRFVVAIPNVKRGLAKKEEMEAFKRLPPMPTEDIGKICRLTMFKLLPALLEQEIQIFGEALTEIQILIGDYFAQVQGSRYASLVATEVIEFMQKIGAYGVGQSSWGPAIYGLARGRQQAEEIEDKVQTLVNERSGGQVFIAKANNKGACLKIIK